ncbi:helix-turn-helix transcriptional regulator [Paenibacillus methanolicus]|uniref:AraC-like DNA-binding protein n=1 Tax=Paenibacillus methanolicus TaxID=582686 RepID=A0A5S5CHG3_9BACL|nr:AraC family transcriptional regulator [Paenibacillus methanolicus]TYP79162.1 AraC-like DNA-binding protein [Paenibacillus methanolicus]
MIDAMREDHHEWLDIHFLTPTEFEKAGAAWPIRIGMNIAKPHYHIGPRISPYYYLIFVLEGEGEFRQSGGEYLLAAGDLFCLFPQVTHEYWTNPLKRLRKLFFAFEGKGALSLLARAGLTPQRPHASGGATNEASALAEELRRLAAESGGGSDLLRLSLFLRIFDALSLRSASYSVSAGQDTWLQNGRAYLDIHYAEDIAIERVAAAVGVERSHFTKMFRHAYGMPPMQYLLRLRMNEARLLLEQTGYTVADIARSVGYPDLFSFSKAFKKHAGISPKSYRQRKTDSHCSGQSDSDSAPSQSKPEKSKV